MKLLVKTLGKLVGAILYPFVWMLGWFIAFVAVMLGWFIAFVAVIFEEMEN